MSGFGRAKAWATVVLIVTHGRTKPGKPTGRWERMTWLDARMVTLLEMVDEREQGFEEEEFRQELLAFFGEVRVALVKARETTALLPQNPSSFFSSRTGTEAP